MPTVTGLTGVGIVEVGDGSYDHVSVVLTTIPFGAERLDDGEPKRLQRAAWFAPVRLLTDASGVEEQLVGFKVIWVDFERMLWPCEFNMNFFSHIRYHIYPGGVMDIEAS